MRRDQLEHAIRAACDVSGDTEILIFGSQAILGTYPFAPESLRASIEVDMQPKNFPENTDRVDGALGELSRFHQTHGFYVHGVSIEGAALPKGWKERTVTISDFDRTNGHTGYCLEAYDLAASKLVADRDKDREFVATLMLERLIDGELLIKRIAELPIEAGLRQSLAGWVQIMLTELK
ncbi:MAG: DUF6036 family nucleotidyltransferase [Thermoleophilia bacterium]